MSALAFVETLQFVLLRMNTWRRLLSAGGAGRAGQRQGAPGRQRGGCCCVRLCCCSWLCALGRGRSNQRSTAITMSIRACPAQAVEADAHPQHAPPLGSHGGQRGAEEALWGNAGGPSG